MDDAFDPDALPRVLSRDSALRRGMSRHAIDRRVASGRWRRILPHTYLTSDTLTDLDRMRAAIAFAGDDAVLTGAAALWVSEIRRISAPRTVVVLVSPSNRTRSHEWVTVRRSGRPFDLEQWSGPRRVSIARAAADHALSLRRLDDVRALIARVVRDERCTVEELGAEVAGGPRRGSALIRQALAEIGAGAASAPEAEAARILRTARVPPFEQNAVILRPEGSRFVVDFLWRRLRAVLEIDSVEHHLDPADWRRTMDRHLALTAIGYSVVHRPPSALRIRAGFVADIAEWLAAREAELFGPR